jgi:hypothetical protein
MNNTTKITVRLDAEQRAAELELVTPHSRSRIDGLEPALRKLGLLSTHTLELHTPKYRITRTKLRQLDGSAFDSTRLVQVLHIVRAREFDHSRVDGFREAS